MDANRLRFWMLADERDWNLALDPIWWPGDQAADRGAGVRYDTERQTLRLISQSERTITIAPAALGDARSRVEQIPRARDGYGTRARWNSATHQIVATGAFPSEVPILTLSATEQPTDIALGYDGVLYVATNTGAIIMQDRRDRWQPVRLQHDQLMAWRLAADPAGGVWVLDRTNRRLARLVGLPLPERPWGTVVADTFQPCEENPHPPQLSIYTDSVCPNNEEPSGLACSPDGRLATLVWTSTGESLLRLLNSDGSFTAPCILHGAPRAYSLAWVSTDALAVLLANLQSEAPVYPIITGAIASLPIGDLYPLREHSNGPFMHGVDLPPHFPTASSSLPLHHLSLPAYARRGRTANRSAQDSGSAQTIWHRLYLEADIPPGCSIDVYLAASDNADAPPAEKNEWYQHRFGARAPEDNQLAPIGAWVPQPSEIAYQPGMLPCAPVKNRSGLFTTLIQRSTRRVRSLRGRFLHLRVELHGDGRSSPEIAALRAYGSRFSYIDRYLPEFYREQCFEPEADEDISGLPPPATTPADFLERFLGNFEGILTPLEDRIGGAYLLTDPHVTRPDALEWLGSWIGVSFEPQTTTEQRRELLRAAPLLFRERGTLRGLQRALDLATNGAVSGGEIVIVEDFRLRRTFATILGADLADEYDPLLAGLAVSGNSFVGDTLFLGDEHNKEFLALFSADLQTNATEADMIAGLFDRLAHRVTVLVRQEIGPQDLGLISRVVEIEKPAHVDARVVAASERFLVGVAALIGIDTYLGNKPAPQPVKVERSYIGVRDLIRRPPSLDPRLEGGYSGPVISEAPIASAGPPTLVDFGTEFTLDASASHAADGRRIVSYIWTMLE